jgi:hypothetical protein
MIKEFTYPLPDELYIEGVSGKIKEVLLMMVPIQ